MRGIFGSKRDDIKIESRKLHNYELQNLNSSPNITVSISKRMRCAGHVICMGKMVKLSLCFN
jgi:hypothetical protein